MKILALHNYYQQPGGEDQLFEDEVQLLRGHGHHVICKIMRNKAIKPTHLIRVALETVWNRRMYRQMTHWIQEHRPDLVHIVNTFPLYSPAVFHAARKADVPVVATVQNYRYFCAQGMCYRDNRACEACMNKVPWRAVTYACYRGSRLGSASVAIMQWLHQKLQTWNQYVDVVCVASEFSKSKLMAAGIHPHQMIIKPNFLVHDPGCQTGDGKYAMFVGRLADEKGIQTLVDAWYQLPSEPSPIVLKIAGDGPNRHLVEKLVAKNPNVQWLGRQTNEQVLKLLGGAACLIFPTTGYESLPKTLIESMAVGTPVLGSEIGSIPEIVCHRQTGFLFPVGDSVALANMVQDFFSNLDHLTPMRANCRQLFEERFTAETNYRDLMALYQEAIRRRRGAAEPASNGSSTETEFHSHPVAPLADCATPRTG